MIKKDTNSHEEHLSSLAGDAEGLQHLYSVLSPYSTKIYTTHLFHCRSRETVTRVEWLALLLWLWVRCQVCEIQFSLPASERHELKAGTNEREATAPINFLLVHHLGRRSPRS